MWQAFRMFCIFSSCLRPFLWQIKLDIESFVWLGDQVLEGTELCAWWLGHVIISASSRNTGKWLRATAQEGSRWHRQLFIKAGSGPHLLGILAQTVCFSLAHFLLQDWPRVHFSTTFLEKEKGWVLDEKENISCICYRVSRLLDRFLLSASSSSLKNGHGDAEQEEYTRTFQSSRISSNCSDH